jgi:hypothetical protein
MNIVRNGVCAVTALALGGCATMEQAPLVYSSKTSVGIDISTTSTETPGLSMSVGVKLVDAAYVPVAVSKRCQKKDGTYDCRSSINGVHLVGGTASASGDADDIEGVAKDADFQKAVGEYGAALTNAQNAKRALTEAEKDLEELKGWQQELDAFKNLESELSQLRSSINSPNLSTSNDDATRKAAESRIKEIEELAPDKNKIGRLNLDPGLRNAKTRVDNATAAENSALDTLAEKSAKLSATRDALATKKDSYSVFGSFENKNSAGTKGASVSLGKIFATGVASQNISQGLQSFYQLRDSTACYEAVQEQSAKIQEKDLVRLLEKCINLSKK